MPSRILRKRKLSPGMTSELVIEAPHIAAKALPGNFVILRVWEDGERIPLTIADADKDAGTITLVYLVMGKTTAHLETLDAGDDILDLCGPLGRPTEIHKVDGPVICVGGGTGIAAMHHIAKGHAQAGPHGIGLKAARDGRMVDAQGQPQPRVFILGSLRIGCIWESIAIPELRGQADTAVRGLLAPPAA